MQEYRRMPGKNSMYMKRIKHEFTQVVCTSCIDIDISSKQNTNASIIFRFASQVQQYRLTTS